jgi:hypothetical protein
MKATIRSNLACWLMAEKRWGMSFRNVLVLQTVTPALRADHLPSPTPAPTGDDRYGENPRPTGFRRA